MFRFTIRDVLWLTALVAMGVGWWVDRSGLGRRLTELETEHALKLLNAFGRQHQHEINLLRLENAKLRSALQKSSPDNN